MEIAERARFTIASRSPANCPASIVEASTGDEQLAAEEPDTSSKHPDAVALVHLGGLKGGKARACEAHTRSGSADCEVRISVSTAIHDSP